MSPRRRPGDLAANYRVTVSQDKLDELHVLVELTTGRPRYAQWWVERAGRGPYPWHVKAAPSPKAGPITVHKTYEQACTRAHRNAIVWLHSALGTGLKAPRRLP